jgi:excisionase family DNA binding protein
VRKKKKPSTNDERWTPPPVMTTEQAARYLQLNRETVKQLLRTGAIPGLKLGRAWRISKTQLDAVFAGGKPAEAAPAKPKGVMGTVRRKP